MKSEVVFKLLCFDWKLPNLPDKVAQKYSYTKWSKICKFSCGFFFLFSHLLLCIYSNFFFRKPCQLDGTRNTTFTVEHSPQTKIH